MVTSIESREVNNKGEENRKDTRNPNSTGARRKNQLDV
jgi:hypothetical protein